jgi:hypothetical protein
MSVTCGVSRAHARRILIGAAVLLGLGMGLRQGLGPFRTPVTRDLGLTATTFTLAIAIQKIVRGPPQAPIGGLADRFGLRAGRLAWLRENSSFIPKYAA